MKSRLTACCVIAFLLPAVVAGQPLPAPSERLTLETAVRLAVAHNRQIEVATLQVAKAEADLAVARTRRLPSFDISVLASQLLTPATFSFPRGAFGDYPGIGPIPSTDTEVSTQTGPTGYISSQLLQPITQLKRLGLGVSAAATARDVEHERVRGQRLAIVTAVKRLYYAIQQTESALQASDETLTLYRELDRTLDVRVAQKVALRSDALDVKSRLAQENFTRLTRTHALASQKEQLNQLLGRDVRTSFETDPVPSISLLEVDLDAARSRALEGRPDVTEARLRLKQAELDHRAKKAERIPDVSLAVSYSSNVNIDVLPRNLATAGVQVKWEPFDWGRKSNELAVKSHTIVQARLAVRETEDRALVEINAAFRRLAESRSLLDVADVTRTAAREKLRVKTNQFQVQAALVADVLHLRAALADSQDRYQQALLAFWTAKADFEHAVGEDVIP